MHTKSLILAGVFLAPALAAQSAVSVGDTPTFSFTSEPMFGAGVKSLDDLRGQPTMIEFWGVR